jgi:hypothetical protein
MFVDILGHPVIEPSVSSLWSFDQSSQQRFVAQHDVVLLSAFEGGTPGVLTPYIDLRALQRVYDPENLKILGADLADYLVRPSFDINVRGAYRLWVIRLGAPTKASLMLQNVTPANTLLLTSTDYGSYVNKISAEVASGTVVGKRVTLRFRQEVLTLDNLQNAFHLGYTGNGTTATLTVTRVADRATRLQTALTGATDGSISLDLDLTQDTFATVQQLATYLNGQNGYRCSIDRYGDALLPTYELDTVSAATIRTPIALVIRYVGAGSAATMTTTGTTLATTVTGGPGGENLALDLLAAPTDTLGELVAYIDGLAAYTCTLGANADAEASCNTLFTAVSGQDIRTANYSLLAGVGKMDYVLQAALGSIIFAINSRSLRVVASRVTNMTLPPANLAQTFLAGGTNPVPVLADWLNALDVVAQQDLAGGLVFPVTTDPIMKDVVLAWVLEQHSNHGASFRTFLAPPDHTSIANAKLEAMAYNSTFCLTIPQPVVASNGLEVSPLYPTAMACGAAAGALPTQSITNMVLRARALPARAKFDKATREDLLANGVCVLREEQGVGVVISLAVTTALTVDRIDHMLSESMVRDVIEQRVRAAVKPLLPSWMSLTFMATVMGAVITCLINLERDGIINQGINAQNKILRAWMPPTITASGGILRVTVHVLIGGEVVHIDIDGLIGYQEFTATAAAA